MRPACCHSDAFGSAPPSNIAHYRQSTGNLADLVSKIEQPRRTLCDRLAAERHGPCPRRFHGWPQLQPAPELGTFATRLAALEHSAAIAARENLSGASGQKIKNFTCAVGQIRGTESGNRHGRWVRDAMDALVSQGERCRCVRQNRVVLTPRRWCQVGGSHSAGDGGKKARSPGRARNKP